MRLIRLPIPRVNVVKRPSMRPSMPSAPSRKRKSSRSRTITVEAPARTAPVARKSTVAKWLVGGAAVAFVGLVALTPDQSYPMPDTSVSATIDNAEVTSSDINDYAPETTPAAAPSTECDAYVPAKYRACPTAVDSSRYPLTIPKAKAPKPSKSSARTSSPSVTTTTSVRKSTSATGAKSTTTTKSVKVSK